MFTFEEFRHEKFLKIHFLADRDLLSLKQCSMLTFTYGKANLFLEAFELTWVYAALGRWTLVHVRPE